jgi:hypothetical protein
MHDLQTACDALIAWARGQCGGCHGEDWMNGKPLHTCRKYIELARDVGMATMLLVLHEWDGNEAEATLNRLLGGD